MNIGDIRGRLGGIISGGRKNAAPAPPTAYYTAHASGVSRPVSNPEYGIFDMQYGEPPRGASMKYRYDAYESDPVINNSGKLHVAYSVSGEYEITCNPDSGGIGDRITDSCMNWAYDVGLADINQTIATWIMATGNCIMIRPKYEAGMTVPVFMDTSRFIGITTDPDNRPVYYHAESEAAASHLTYRAEDILHFAYQPERNSPWGTALCQQMLVPGMPYVDPAGNTVRPPPTVEQNAMEAHTHGRKIQQGIPRHMFSPRDKEGMSPEAMSAFGQSVAASESGGVITSNVPMEHKSVGLESYQKMNDAYDYNRARNILGSLNPLIIMQTEIGGMAYLSSLTALKTMLPGIDIYRRAHARFIELEILRPMVIHEYGESAWMEARPRIRWPNQDLLNPANIDKYVQLAETSALRRRLDPESFFSAYVGKVMPGVRLLDESEVPPAPVPPGMPGGPGQKQQQQPPPAEGGKKDDDNEDEEKVRFNSLSSDIDRIRRINADAAGLRESDRLRSELITGSRRHISG